MTLPQELEKSAIENSTLPPINDVQDDVDEVRDNYKIDARIDATENSINNDDLIEIEEELNHFTGIDVLNIKDYSKEKIVSDSSMLNITINGKNMLVKKSTLCWFFSEKKRKLSSDRRLRCKGITSKSQTSSQEKTKKSIPFVQKKKSLKKMCNKSNSDSEETSNSVGSYSEKSEFETESFSEGESNDGSKEDRIKISISNEKYYAAFYDTWYIGRILESLENDTFKMKFLKSELDMYIWPSKEDIQVIKKNLYFMDQ